MQNILLPTKVEYQADSENKNEGSIIIEPCYPGYGITWGNALRRVLLSSLPGAAVTAVKIKGVKHEFSTLPYVKEDILEIVLNLKMLRLKILGEGDELIKLPIKLEGVKKIKGADFRVSPEVKIANPDLEIATLTDKKAKLEMDVWVSKGRGYIPSEEKSREGFDIGTIMLDSMFSPIVKVEVSIENIRVEKRTDYDKLCLTIETDGIITPWQAFIEAAKMLADQFRFLKEGLEKETAGLKELVTEPRGKKVKKVIKKILKKKKKK